MRKTTKKSLLMAIPIVILLVAICTGILWTNIKNTRYNVYCHLIRPGMSKQDVTLALHTLGEYNEEGGPNNYYVSYKGNILTKLAVGHMALLFDKQGLLVGTAKEISLGDWGEGYKCK